MKTPLNDSNISVDQPLLSKQQTREMLWEIARNRELPPGIRIRAMVIECKLAGHYAPRRMVIEIGPKTLKVLKDLVASLVSLTAKYAP